jgi:predicted Zn-dependent protease
MLRQFVVLTACATVFAACQTVQTTNPGVVGVNRTQHFLVSEEQVQAASAQAYAQQLQEASQKNALNKDAQLTARVRKIAGNLERASGSFRADAPSWKWEVNTLATDELNAYAMPGGKIMVYDGLVKHLNLSDDEIAAVMGHEISHALREHSRERVSRQYAQQLAISGAAAILGADTNITDLANTVATVTFQLPFSREQEAEADTVGIELMARAGYNPNAAVSLWKKMIASEQQHPPEFLSTHPSSENRIENLQALVPKVMPLYQTASR